MLCHHGSPPSSPVTTLLLLPPPLLACTVHAPSSATRIRVTRRSNLCYASKQERHACRLRLSHSPRPCKHTYCRGVYTRTQCLQLYDARQCRSVYSSAMTCIMTLKLLRSSSPLPAHISVHSRIGDIRVRNTPQPSRRPAVPPLHIPVNPITQPRN